MKPFLSLPGLTRGNDCAPAARRDPVTPAGMTRRAFLGTTAGLAIAAGSGLEPGRGAEAKPAWQIGCYTRPFDDQPYPAALDAIAEAGFKYAGIMTAKGKSWVIVNADTTPEEAAQVGEAARQRGLKAVSVYGDFPAGTDVEKNVEILRRLVQRCVACGSPDLMLGGTSEETLYEPYYRSIRECCDFAASQGVRLTIKPHGGQNATGPQCRKAIEGVGHRNFRLWYDPGNIFYYSDGRLDPVEDAAAVDGLVAGMSVKDFLPPKEVMVTPGTGKVDFPSVLARLRKGGFVGGPLVVECLVRGDRSRLIAEARKVREWLEALVKQVAA